MSKKVAVITGTSSGVGLELAEYLAKNNYQVIGLSRKIADSNLFETIPTDITQKEEVINAIETIKNKYGRIDVLINNAGKGMVGPIENATEQEIISLFQLNFISIVHLLAEVLPIMREQKSGKIINISSIGSEMGLPFRGMYSASKSALDKLTESLRYEILNTGIEACSLHLGDVKTGIAQSRINSRVGEVYQGVYDRVFKGINQHVDEGSSTKEVSQYIYDLLQKNHWKPHYYYGKFGQKMGVVLKKILPQKRFEKMMIKYSKI